MSQPNNIENVSRSHEMGFHYALEWFKYHADQRYKAAFLYVIQLFVTPVAAIAVSLLTSQSFNTMIKSAEFWLAIFVLGCFGMIMTIIFWNLDKRNRELVGLGQSALEEYEIIFPSKSRIFAEKKALHTDEHPKLQSHSGLFTLMFQLGTIIFAFILVIGFYNFASIALAR